MSAVVPKSALAPSSSGDILLADAGEHRDLDCGDQSHPFDLEKFWMKDMLFCSGHTVLGDGSTFATGGLRSSYNWDEPNLGALGLPAGQVGMTDVEFGGGVPFCQKWDWSITDGAWTRFDTYLQGIGDPLVTAPPSSTTPVSKTLWYACAPQPIAGRGLFWGNERYYPTATLMTDGKVLITSGQVFLTVEARTTTTLSPLFFPAQFTSFNTSIELFDPATMAGSSEVLSSSTNDPSPTQPVAPAEVFNTDYSHVFVLPEPVVAGSSGEVRDVLILGEAGKPLGYSVRAPADPERGTFYQGWPVRPQAPDPSLYDPVNHGASTVLLPIRLSGSGGAVNDFGYHNGAVLCAGGYILSNGELVERSRIDAFDPLGASPNQWFASANLVKGRGHPMTVLLPDGTIAVLGGHDTPTASSAEVRRAEYVDLRSSPGTLTATYGTYPDPAAMTGEPRGYHAVAVLRPDGRVFIGGGREASTTSLPMEKTNFRILSPPYMQGPRPEILAIQDKNLKRQGVAGSRPTTTTLSVFVPSHDAPSEAVMMTLGSMTHSYDMSQRYVEVAISGMTAGNGPGKFTFTVTSPPQQWTPPGYHMLFVLDQNHVPSAAVVVHLQ